MLIWTVADDWPKLLVERRKPSSGLRVLYVMAMLDHQWPDRTSQDVICQSSEALDGARPFRHVMPVFANRDEKDVPV
jgi:hypothetical protein